MLLLILLMKFKKCVTCFHTRMPLLHIIDPVAPRYVALLRRKEVYPRIISEAQEEMKEAQTPEGLLSSLTSDVLSVKKEHG